MNNFNMYVSCIWYLICFAFSSFFLLIPVSYFFLFFCSICFGRKSCLLNYSTRSTLSTIMTLQTGNLPSIWMNGRTQRSGHVTGHMKEDQTSGCLRSLLRSGNVALSTLLTWSLRQMKQSSFQIFYWPWLN